MIWLLCNVAVIHELPLHIVTEAFSTIDVFKKLNCYEKIGVYGARCSFRKWCVMGIFIDENICNGCKGLPEARCERICPGDLCYRKENMKATIRDQSACWTCACCVKECPVQAIELRLPFQASSNGASLKARLKRDKTIWTVWDDKGHQEEFIIQARCLRGD